MSDFQYDEFSYFHENIEEWDIRTSVPNVRRFFVSVDGLRQLSGLRWGDDDPELVLLHGGAQNAHTYDTVALALADHSLIALDLPGHGHSDPSIYPASAIASLAWSAIDLTMASPLAMSTPPVSMSRKRLPAHSQTSSLRSRVVPLVS